MLYYTLNVVCVDDYNKQAAELQVILIAMFSVIEFIHFKRFLLCLIILIHFCQIFL